MATTERLLESARPKRNCVKNADNSVIMRKQEAKEKERKVKEILAKPAKSRNKEDKKMLQEYREIAREIERRARLKEMVKKKIQEIEDDSDVLEAKIDDLVSAIKCAKHVVVYTGAGISTAASIPDYRGPNGVWTRLQMGQEVRTQSLVDADPTLTHMAITELHQQGVVQHVVSQNCDGLHLRSGLPQRALSEVHGNMFIEVCTECDPEVQYVRLFDVTERTACRRHMTGRRCHTCSCLLRDSIVHFGEKGTVQQPLNWHGAMASAKEADMIVCLGSTLKVLKRYACLWGTNRRKSKQPKLYIVNLQWTPKDKMAVSKIHGRCDDVMKKIMSKLELRIPEYRRLDDPIFTMATPLRKSELESFSTKLLSHQPVVAGSIQSKPVRTGLGQEVDLAQSPATGQVILKSELHSDADSQMRIGTDWTVSSVNDSSQKQELTKPGWFGKGYHKKTTRSRKRRKLSQDSV